MFGVQIRSEDERAGWQKIADSVSRQRPYSGRTAVVVRGRKLRGATVTVLRHMRDAYSDAFRYGGAGNLALREMKGRAGYVCQVRCEETGAVAWIKAPYLMCTDVAYPHWTAALSDALIMGTEAG